ncbi:hypothetical protein B0O80DRAFT_449469 [Mortierella sp. GBAus27b]|nr:hypothetical protein B0O80DRAFT_449469 [Mortierella sp. GBAus27b]
MSRPTLIVTGASRGIGKSIVQLAIKSLDANVIGIARSQESLQQLSEEVEDGGRFTDRFKFVVGDVTSESVAQKAVALAKESWSGRIDGLVVNAAVIGPIGPIASTAVEEWKSVYDVNFFSILTIVQLSLPALRESKGRIILVSSSAAHMPLHGWGAYCSSKAALKMFGEILAIEEPGVTTISIHPGIVDTEMQGAIRERGRDNMVPDQHTFFMDLHQNKQLLHPDEPGHIIAALAVRGATSLTGKFVAVDDAEMKAYSK